MRKRTKRRTGAILMLVAVCLPAVLVMIAMAIDVAWMQLARTELRTATDAASRAGAKVLGMTQDVDQARAAAVDAASRNVVAGESFVIEPGDVEIGVSSQPSENRAIHIYQWWYDAQCCPSHRAARVRLGCGACRIAPRQNLFDRRVRAGEFGCRHPARPGRLPCR